MSSREQFEAWWEVNYHNGNPPRFGWAAWRDGDGYKIDDDESELDGMWNAWQAATSAIEDKCAALAAEKEKFAVECAATKIAIAYLKSGRHDFTLNTPATEAFLSEVRAQGVDSAAGTIMVHMNHQHAAVAEALHILRTHAAQLRQDANTAELVAAGIITKVGE